MNTLRKLKCEACQIGAPLATPKEIDEYMQQIPDWTIVEIDGVKRLRRTFTFKDFKTALAFTNKLGELADQEDHHPAILTEWGKVTVSWWSHKIKGLHKNDFIMAAKTDALV
ncbi:MAG: 4a-hydroxytetrahydrobiopterin dehydratase [Gammaproteobacteria bacterium]|nr:4a-hydroxytetrahydrobiopterin dehydratase [Gammaproteobacteria bacterium]